MSTKQDVKVDLEAVFAKRGGDMDVNEAKALAEAGNETLRAVNGHDMKGWAARLPSGRRTKAQADAVIAAEGRAIILKLVSELNATKAELELALEPGGDTTSGLPEAAETAAVEQAKEAATSEVELPHGAALRELEAQANAVEPSEMPELAKE